MLGQRRNGADCEMELEWGDLGLGRGLRPGAIPKDETNLDFFPCTNNVALTAETVMCATKCLQDMSLDTRTCDAASANGCDSKISFEAHPVNELRRHVNCSHDDGNKCEKSTVSRWEKNLKKQLEKARKEIECLQKDMLNCRNQLISKVKVIKLLNSQSLASQTEDRNAICKLKRLNVNLQKDVNRLVFELGHKVTSVTSSEETWAERFDGLATENLAMQDALRDMTEEMKQLHRSNIALKREQKELLALLEVKEKQRYEALSSVISADDFNNFSSMELAVLGACQCGQSDDPCSCAESAANLKRDFRKLKDNMDMHKKHHREALITVDAYRTAFEEQLSRNKTLIKKMADIAIATTPVTPKASSIVERMDKAKAMLKFLIQTMKEDIPDPQPSPFPVGALVWSCTAINKEGRETATTDDQLVGKTHEELMQILIDMMSDRGEALAHHRHATRLLGQHTRDLEEKLSQVMQEQHVTSDLERDYGKDRPNYGKDLPNSTVSCNERRCSSDEGIKEWKPML